VLNFVAENTQLHFQVVSKEFRFPDLMELAARCELHWLFYLFIQYELEINVLLSVRYSLISVYYELMAWLVSEAGVLS
jgi:hypothetical protein